MVSIMFRMLHVHYTAKCRGVPYMVARIMQFSAIAKLITLVNNCGVRGKKLMRKLWVFGFYAIFAAL